MQEPSYTAFSDIVLESDILAGKSRAGKKFPRHGGKNVAGFFIKFCCTEGLNL
jgi:hypothetical protein